jgi:glycosyltransferase involved in cell wall biosynthesis
VKICFVTAEFPPLQGGVGDHTAYLGRALARLGVEVHILTSVTARRPAEDNSSPSDGEAQPTVHPLVADWGWGCWRSILEFARQEKPDILHIQYQAAAYRLHPAINFFPWRLRREGTRRPSSVVTFHDLRIPYLFPKAGPLRWWTILALACWCDAVITTNAEDQATLARYDFVRSLARVPLGSNVEPQLPPDYGRERWRARWGASPETILLCYFGFLSESKGSDTLVGALDMLLKKGYNIHLLMIGGHTGDADPTNVAYAARVEALIGDLDLADKVSWTGYVPPAEVSASLMASDLCVMPYRDGISFRRTTLIAALRHGLPVVSTHPRVPLQELADGRNIALVPPDDPIALAGRIAALADDRQALKRLAKGARALGRAFDWEAIAARTLDVYRGVRA